MKKNKKIGLAGFLIAFAFMCFNMHVFAEDTHKVNLSTDNLNPAINDNFNILVNLETTSDRDSCTINISYDANKLSLENVTGVNNFTRNPLSLTVKTQNLKANSQIRFKAIGAGTTTIKVDSVGNCGTSAGLGSVDINVKDVVLSNISLTNGELSPAFNSSTTTYNATINSDKTNISATAENGIKITGTGEQTLNEGETKTVRITATSANGSEKTYTINLSRPQENKSENHYLKSITFNGETINIEQDKSTYTLIVKNDVTTVDLKYELEDEKSTATVRGPEELEVGINTFTITVTAEDGSTKEYKLLVTRQDTKNIIDNDMEAILNEIENGTENYIYVSVNQDEENKIMDKRIAEALKKYEKTLVYEITNEDGDILYSVTLKGKDIKNENVDLNYGMTFRSDNKTKIDALAENAKIMYLNFDGEDDLPGNLTIKVFVGDNFKNKDVLYLYYYNEKDNKLEKVQKKLTVKNGYVEFEIEKLGEYVLSTTDFDAPVTKEETNNIIMYAIIGGAILLVIMIIIIIIILKKKKKKNGDKPKKEKKKKGSKKEVQPEQSEELEKTIVVNSSELNPSVIANTPNVVTPTEDTNNDENAEKEVFEEIKQSDNESTENENPTEDNDKTVEIPTSPVSSETQVSDQETQDAPEENNSDETQSILPTDNDDVEIIVLT